MDKNDAIGHFVASLAETAAGTQLSNPYAERVACENLRVFLAAHDPVQDALLLVGEAPGYRGAAQSGVPLTSISVLVDSWDDPWDAFGSINGYLSPPRAIFHREATATMVWRGAARVLPSTPLPLTWNAMPFHPIGASVHSNRSLRKSEVESGRRWLEGLLELFPNSRPVALGHRAAEALSAVVSQNSIRRT